MFTSHGKVRYSASIYAFISFIFVLVVVLTRSANTSDSIGFVCSAERHFGSKTEMGNRTVSFWTNGCIIIHGRYVMN